MRTGCEPVAINLWTNLTPFLEEAEPEADVDMGDLFGY
jgi:hypothetical protein